MADNSFGLSFSPAQQADQNARGRSDLSPVQEAIQILSLRRPTVVGAASPVPNLLLSGAGGGANSLSALLETLRRQFGATPGQYQVPRLPRESAPPNVPDLFHGQFPPMAPSVPSPSFNAPPLPPKLTFGDPGDQSPVTNPAPSGSQGGAPSAGPSFPFPRDPRPGGRF